MIICRSLVNFCPKINVIDESKNFLSTKFGMENQYDVDVILGIKIKRKIDDFSLCQPHYIKIKFKKIIYFDVV